MPDKSTKRLLPDSETPLRSNPASSLPAASPALDAASISELRAFFELLDAWDLKENTDEK
jgi:hypothetical protein